MTARLMEPIHECDDCGHPFAESSNRCPACGAIERFAVRYRCSKCRKILAEDKCSTCELAREAYELTESDVVKDSALPELTPAAPESRKESESLSAKLLVLWSLLWVKLQDCWQEFRNSPQANRARWFGITSIVLGLAVPTLGVIIGETAVWLTILAHKQVQSGLIPASEMSKILTGGICGGIGLGMLL